MNKSKEEIREYRRKYYREHKGEIKKYRKKYREAHKNKIAGYNKKYQFSHKETVSNRNKEYYKLHQEQIKADNKKYYYEHHELVLECARKYKQSEKGRSTQHQYIAKRRNLGFIELNDYFDGAEAHHINKTFVLYIPKEIHRSVWHNVWTGQGMEEINEIAIDWAYGI